MRIWLPYIRAASGSDVFTERLAAGLASAGHEVVIGPFSKNCQYAPWIIRKRPGPAGTDVVIAPGSIAFACRRPETRLVSIIHHCVYDPAHRAARSSAQALYHKAAVRRFDQASLRAADATVAVSAYTARSVARSHGIAEPRVILNAIDTSFFTPGEQRERRPGEPFRLLFVGNPTRRKGGDLLAPILGRLGPGFALSYTTGLRQLSLSSSGSALHCLGRLDDLALRQAYRDADVLLFPSRLEGFGYAVAEAMACGTPVVASDCSALPELVEHGRTGLLCPVGDISAFASAITELAANPQTVAEMGKGAREFAATHLNLARWIRQYVELLDELVAGRAGRATADAA